MKPASEWGGIHLKSNFSGLCNRLRGLAALRSIAHHYSIPIQVSWQPNWTCPGQWGEMFKVPGDLPFSDSPPEGWFVIDGTGRSCGLKAGTTLCTMCRRFCPGVSIKALQPHYTASIRSLELCDEAQSRFDEFAAKNDIHSLVGLHVRRTDLTKAIRRSRRTEEALEDPVWRRIDSLPDDTKFFLATDDGATQAAYLSRYPDRVVVLPKTYSTGWKPGVRKGLRQTSMQDAVLDLYLLSRCKKIYGTVMSSFSRYAARLGGISVRSL